MVPSQALPPSALWKEQKCSGSLQGWMSKVFTMAAPWGPTKSYSWLKNAYLREMLDAQRQRWVFIIMEEMLTKSQLQICRGSWLVMLLVISRTALEKSLRNYRLRISWEKAGNWMKSVGIVRHFLAVCSERSLKGGTSACQRWNWTLWASPANSSWKGGRFPNRHSFWRPLLSVAISLAALECKCANPGNLQRSGKIRKSSLRRLQTQVCKSSKSPILPCVSTLEDPPSPDRRTCCGVHFTWC